MKFETFNTIAKRNGTDKTQHQYPILYDVLFTPLRHYPVRVLEIGFSRGRGVRTLAEYFPRGVIHSLDINDCTHLLDKFPEDIRERVRVHQVDQGDSEAIRAFLDKIANSARNKSKRGPRQFHLVIDDGSHQLEHQLVSFNTLWSSVAPGGYYIIEDMHCAYERGGDTAVHYFTNRIHEVNQQYLKDYRQGINREIPSLEWVMFPCNQVVLKKRDE